MYKSLKMAALWLLVLCLFLGSATAVLAESEEFTEEELAAIAAALDDTTKDVPVSEEFRVVVSPDDLAITPDLDEAWVNILLLGTDTGNIQLNYGRTDTMIIMSVNRETGKVLLSSLVRDMYVKMPQMNYSAKINAANAFGGPLLAVKAVNETFGLNIRSYVSINFNGFTRVIDSLGGVNLVLSPGEAGILKLPSSEEPQLLTGTQALDYVRIRSLDSNFGRNERQRKLLSSMFNKMLTGSDLSAAMAALTESLQHMATNLSINDLMTLVMPVFSGMESMETTGFPVIGDYWHETSPQKQSIIAFDLERTRQKMHDFIYQGITP